MQKAAFLDRDGVINVDHGYVHTKEDFEWIPGVKEAARMLHEAGYLLIVVTNQSGIARGMFTEEEFLELDSYMREEFAKAGAPVARTYYCPHHPQGIVPKYSITCNCRKPAPGLFLKAIKEFDIDPAQSVAFGDSLRDLAAAQAAGVSTRVLLSKNGTDRPLSCNANTQAAKDLYSAVPKMPLTFAKR